VIEMGWEQAGRRYRLVHDVAGDFAKGGRRALAAWRPAIDTEYGDLDAFLRDVQRRYYRAAEARLDTVLEAPPADPEASVLAVLDEVAEIYPALRRLLEEFADLPAVAEGDARFRRSVRAATGVDLSARHDEKGTSDDREPVLRRPALRPVCAWLH
jgi:hypothetical protein